MRPPPTLTATLATALTLSACGSDGTGSPETAAQQACRGFIGDRLASASAPQYLGEAARPSPGTDRYTVTGSVNGEFYTCEVVLMSDGQWSLVRMDGLTPTLPPAPPRASLTVPTPTTPPEPSGPADTIGTGTHVVGTDIQAGTYKTTGPLGSSSCYWARLKDTTGDGDSLLANGLEDGPSTVTIKKSDGAFETRRCSLWTKTG